jgi:RNA polymerase sigma-54 factor
MAGMQQVARMALQQTLSPQMQQSLHVLQAPLTELRSLVDAELRSNPALEEVPSEKPPLPDQAPAPSPLREQWNDYYAQRPSGDTWTREALERRQHFLDSRVRPPTLQEHLLEQLKTASWDHADNTIAAEIIGNLDEGGYLRAATDEIAQATDSFPSEVDRVLAKVQDFDPPGIAARDLAECLHLQLLAKGRRYSTETRIVRHYLDALGRKKLHEIAKALDLPLPEIQRAAEAISHLDPAPGRAFAPDTNQIIVPEVIISHDPDTDDFSIDLNTDEIPRLRIADDYKDMLGSGGKDVRDYLRDKIRGGNFFIRSIQQRQHTVLAIAREIATRQRDFLLHGPSHLRPMTMSQVADAVGVHETTVSRAVAGKFLSTPQGIFEMKYFFTHGYANAEGDSVSNESVRQAIAQIVKEENPDAPLSDQAIAKNLADRGIQVARRTIAKYREQLGILPSNLRKSF